VRGRFAQLLRPRLVYRVTERHDEGTRMNRLFARSHRIAAAGLIVFGMLAAGIAIAQQRPAARHKVIRTRDFIAAKNPHPGERVREEILNAKDASQLAGILASIPPAAPGAKPAAHYHTKRESIIQILDGDATEMIDGQPVALAPGDVIFIPPNAKHVLVNNSASREVKYMEFYSTIASETVQVTD
jgi:quercetin dioxygenase-like cupin family protein